ncbi:5627_t:CDS:10 [Paraglomus brasilianum]|uniref:5627_t:CDS:1 n=1 Tax=Paraglomus brasilianum TaxID=144538 RepID=A0A9N8W951_9GLOM|nr:5627_t:CDS:10 [Paraglomus brasilianum]
MSSQIYYRYFTDFQKNPERWSLADFDAWAIANVPGANIIVAHRSFYKFLKTVCASNENGINYTRRLLETKKGGLGGGPPLLSCIFSICAVALHVQMLITFTYFDKDDVKANRSLWYNTDALQMVYQATEVVRAHTELDNLTINRVGKLIGQKRGVDDDSELESDYLSSEDEQEKEYANELHVAKIMREKDETLTIMNVKTCTPHPIPRDVHHLELIYVSDDSDGSDEDCEPIPKLNIDEIGFDEFIDQGDELIKKFSRDTLEDLRKNIKSTVLEKKKIPRNLKSIFQEYVEIALDDDYGLDELRKSIIESYSKKFDDAEENELFLRMQLLFQQLAVNLPVRQLKEKTSEGTLVANFISPILRMFFHNASCHATVWPNTASASAKVRKMANNDPSRAKQPDMIGEVIHNGKFAYELMFGEVTGDGNNNDKKNIIDLIRIGIFMKDSLDLILQKTNVNSVLFGWQCIVFRWTGYFMVLVAPGIYVMIEVGNVDLPKSFDTCATFLSGLDTLRTFQMAYERIAKEVLSAINKDQESESAKSKQWNRPTLSTPAFKKIIRL